ncbi:SRPBCC domain-containing protein [Allosphingosinicella sp.]|jgi:uncharacterized protein YndB with AHSA1/START domain|uniref:SRPBCC domain-containing protein n=1 Tax=Allosphingosinicella sp. TaxID=2823234 RepID=UPI002EE6D532
MSKTIIWRLHTISPPERIWELLTTDCGRELFWAEASRSEANRFTLTFPLGVSGESRVLEAAAHSRFAFTYFGTEVLIELAADGKGGTDLTLTNSRVPEDEYEDMLPGWANVLFPLKATADFGIDLRNRDPSRTWRERYVDQ